MPRERVCGSCEWGGKMSREGEATDESLEFERGNLGRCFWWRHGGIVGG